MGTDLIEKATDSFERKQRRCLRLLDEVNLFTGAPYLSIAVIASPIDGHAFALGDRYRLALSGDRLLVIRGVTIVGHVEEPPASVLDLISGPCPSAAADVVNVFGLTGKAELLL